MKKLSKVEFIKHKKELHELYALGKKYDKQKDPVKKAELHDEVVKRCADLKGKLHLKDCTPEEEQNIFGFSLNSDKTIEEASKEGTVHDSEDDENLVTNDENF